MILSRNQSIAQITRHKQITQIKLNLLTSQQLPKQEDIFSANINISISPSKNTKNRGKGAKIALISLIYHALISGILNLIFSEKYFYTVFALVVVFVDIQKAGSTEMGKKEITLFLSLYVNWKRSAVLKFLETYFFLPRLS